MAFSTLNGLNPAGSSSDAVQPSGLYELTEGQPLIAEDQNKDLRDLQELGKQTQLAGVMVAAAITATALTLGFAAGFQYGARQIWQASGTTSYSVPDEAITYLWGCSDGILRPTATAAPPTGFDNTQACLLLKAIAHLGAVTLDLTVQQRSRYADPAARKVTDGPLTLDYGNAVALAQGAFPHMDTVPANVSVNIGAGFQYGVFDTLNVAGAITIAGKVRVTL